MRQFNRKYELQIGDRASGEGITINSLQMSFKVRKSVNQEDKIDKCSIMLYNLSEKNLSKITSLYPDYPVAVFSCGYENNIVRLFHGEVENIETEKKGVDRVTKLSITPKFSELTHKLMSEIVPENSIVQDAIEAVRKNINGLAKGVYKGTNLNQKIIYGYPLSGTPKEMMGEICKVYNLQWRIENESLFINDFSTVESEIRETAPVISPTTGLIDAPYFFTGKGGQPKNSKERVEGVKLTALLNPLIRPGTIVKVIHKDILEYYRIEEVEFEGDFRGNPWYMHLVCSIRGGNGT